MSAAISVSSEPELPEPSFTTAASFSIAYNLVKCGSWPDQKVAEKNAVKSVVICQTSLEPQKTTFFSATFPKAEMKVKLS